MMCWIDEQCNKAMSPTTEEILSRAKDSRALFVGLWAKAFVQAVTCQNILSRFKSCSICPFDPAYLLQHLPLARLKKPSTPFTLECRASLVSPAGSASPESPASGCCSPISRSSSTISDARVLCTLEEINQTTKNDPWNLRLGGFVISGTFIEGASQPKQPKAKAAPKRKLGHRITRNASTNVATEAEPSLAAKGGRLQPNSPPPPRPNPF